MLKSIKIAVAEIYVPVKRQELLDPAKIEVLAEAILEEGHKSPILVRQGNNRYVLIEGLHRLEALKALGENEINAVIVAALVEATHVFQTKHHMDGPVASGYQHRVVVSHRRGIRPAESQRKRIFFDRPIDLDDIFGFAKCLTVVSRASEQDVNVILQWIDPDYQFILDLAGDRFEMGWLKQGRIIPLQTINSAHFILFIVPFLTAMLRRLAKARERRALPTLRALCIEAESLTPENLAVLLKGLSKMKDRGFLDNALVAHYHSLRDPTELCGFREHILSESQPPQVLEETLEDAVSGIAYV